VFPEILMFERKHLTSQNKLFNSRREFITLLTVTVYQHVNLYLFGFQHIFASSQFLPLISQILYMLVTFIAVQIKKIIE
jgi:hypothetical protein